MGYICKSWVICQHKKTISKTEFLKLNRTLSIFVFYPTLNVLGIIPALREIHAQSQTSRQLSDTTYYS